jgi:arginyl-tRNA synthetase
MVAPQAVLAVHVQAAMAAAFGPEHARRDPAIRPSQYADFQANAALALAKEVGLPPREVAARIVEHLDVSGICRDVGISGPGFVNLTLDEGWVAARVSEVGADPRQGVPVQPRQVIPIDYSAPNVAKEMHVGHLRTTIVGDSLARVLELLGHCVVRQNHIGDWGTPFGMLIEHLLDVGEDSPEAALLGSDPNAFYQAARARFDASPEVAARARRRVVLLQGGDPDTLRLWEELVQRSTVYFNTVYATLGVTLTDEDLAGESRYNDQLPAICDELERAGLAVVSDGALCVFLEGHTGREGRPVPLIIRKSDGGYGYATTDLATIRHRVQQLHADRVLYVIGAPQSLHLQMVWETARRAGWLPPDVTPVHVQIGNVLGTDGKILRTRSGAPLRLMALLDEAVERAGAAVAERRPELNDAARAVIAHEVGIGAVKYADLSVSHDSEYVFDFDRMLALQGNTGPYLQYVVARIRSVFRKAGSPAGSPAGAAGSGLPRAGAQVLLTDPAERTLALALLGFGPVVEQVGDSLEPHRLCTYLFELAQAFTGFYERCPILQAAEPQVRASRLALSATTLAVMVRGLDLLGILAPEEM